MGTTQKIGLSLQLSMCHVFFTNGKLVVNNDYQEAT